MDIKAITPAQIQSFAAVVAPITANKLSVAKQSESGKDAISFGAPISAKTGRLSFLNDGSNSIALHAKETDQKLSSAADSIDKMKGALEGIVKNYPPFLPESSERKELLMSYSSLRKELLKLTFPPPPPPIYEKVQHQWQDLFQKDESSSSILLPGELESSTPDSDLKTTISDLTTLHDSIQSVRSDLKQSLLKK